jgi:hypothetical protein
MIYPTIKKGFTMTMISIERTPNNEKAIKVQGYNSSAVLHCQNLIKKIIPACFRRYDRALRCWVVHPLGEAELHHFLCFAEAFVPAEVNRRLAA